MKSSTAVLLSEIYSDLNFQPLFLSVQNAEDPVRKDHREGDGEPHSVCSEARFDSQKPRKGNAGKYYRHGDKK